MRIPSTIQALTHSDLGRQKLWSGFVLGVAFLCTALPLLSATWLPFVDYPQHLGTIAAMAGQGDPTWAHYFDVDLSRVQYLVFYLLAELLALPFGVEWGARMTLVLGLSSLPLAVAAFLRAHNRSTLGAALSAAVVLNIFVFWGFLNYCIACSWALFSLAALARLIQAPNWKNALLYGVWVCLCFYTHAQIYGWLAIASIMQILAAIPNVGIKGARSAGWRALLGALPSVVGMLYWVWASRLLERGMAGLRGSTDIVAGGGPEFQSVARTLGGWLHHSFAFYRDGGGENIAVFMMAAGTLLIAMRAFQSRKVIREEQENIEIWWAPELVFAFALACYLFLPESYKLIAPISHRFLPLALALLPVLGPPRFMGWRSRLIAGSVMIALCLYVGQVHLSHFAESDKEMGELDVALSHTEPGKTLLGLIYDTGSKVTTLPTYLHSHQYYQAHIGGYAAFGFVEFPISPLVYRRGVAPAPFVARFEWTPREFPRRYGSYADFFDYYLLRSAPNRKTPRFYPAGLPSSPTPLYEGKRWKLFGKAL